jgi:two-component system response regulator NreC
MTTNIFLACDHQHLREGLRGILQDSGYQVACAVANGRELIEFIKSSRPFPHICIIDYRMPHMDGIETLQYIKSNWPFIKVMVYTVHDSDDFRATCIASGADGFISKNGTMANLLNAIEELQTVI